MSETRYVKLWGKGEARRLAIRTAGAYVVMQVEHLVSGNVWFPDGAELSLPFNSSAEVGDMTGIFATIWEAMRLEEMAKRAAEAAR